MLEGQALRWPDQSATRGPEEELKMGDQDVRDRTLAQFAATNRRAFLIQGGLAAGSLFIAACGGSSSSSNNAASGGPATSSSDDGPNFKHLALGAAVPFLSLDPH